MNLLVFTTLIISIIALYAQVIGLQTARIFANQKGIGQAMIMWHGAAVSLAANIIKTNNAAYAGTACSLTYNVLPSTPALSRCPSPKNGATLIDANGTITDSSGNLNLVYNTTTTHTECVHLPSYCTAAGPGCTAGSCVASYDLNTYQFYSVLFQISGQNYVATIVPLPTGGQQAYLQLAGPSGNQIALTMTDLMKQLMHTSAPNTSFGYVNSFHQLNTSVLQVTLPNFNNANGAIAMISVPDGF